VFAGVGLRDGVAAVAGLPHDLVGVGAARNASVTNPARNQCPPIWLIWVVV